jgi:outer membrane protein OmpA-like peptidoglycan-associated protein
LPVGAHRVRAAALGLPAREAEIEVGPGEDRNLDFTLRPAPASPDVQLAGEWIKLRRNLRFEGDSARLTPPTAKMLDAVAELLEAHGELRHIQISAHWDASLPRTEADVLTQQQADAVKAYLVARGVAADRLTTAGMGSTRPLVPNLTPANRLRNRRVEFHLE